MFADYMRKVLTSCNMAESNVPEDVLQVIVQQYRLRMLPFAAARAVRNAKKSPAAVGHQQSAA